MANRHEVQKKASGGGTRPKHDANKEEYDGQGSNLMKEAKEEKRGGKVHKKEKKEHKATGGAVKPRLDKRARGGTVASVPGRKRGGGIGADRMPLSSAAKIKEITKGESGEDMGKH